MKDSKENKVKLDKNKWKVTKNVILKKRRKEMKKHWKQHNESRKG